MADAELKKTRLEANNDKLGLTFWLCFLLGWAVIAFGVWTMFHRKSMDNPTYSFELGFGANILHDAIIAPAVCVAAFILEKLIPHRMRRVVNWGLFSSVMVSLIAYPAVRGFGLKADNRTLLPLNYATALITVLGTIWAIVVIICVAQAIGGYRRSKAPVSK